MLAEAAFNVLPGQWSYHEHPAEPAPQPSADALALVRDEESWSVLEPSQGDYVMTALFEVGTSPPQLTTAALWAGWPASSRTASALVWPCSAVTTPRKAAFMTIGSSPHNF